MSFLPISQLGKGSNYQFTYTRAFAIRSLISETIAFGPYSKVQNPCLQRVFEHLCHLRNQFQEHVPWKSGLYRQTAVGAPHPPPDIWSGSLNCDRPWSPTCGSRFHHHPNIFISQGRQNAEKPASLHLINQGISSLIHLGKVPKGDWNSHVPASR